ncbi:MAG: hypothetical protein C0616_13480, partial [Desulfuromonas sp.]
MKRALRLLVKVCVGFISGSLFTVGVAFAELPTGGTLTAGQATIEQSADSLTVQQQSDRAAIDWQTFNVGRDNSVHFEQPSSSSAILNRILDSNPSQIFGQITATGQVYLTNPQGLYFSPEATVDVGGLVATTHSINVDDFMNGTITFERNGATGSIINEGLLHAELGGYIALLAPEVINQGVVVAEAGTVLMASGEQITLNFGDDSSLVGFTATASDIQTHIDNRHAVLAPGGQIILSAIALNDLQGGVINNSGELSATSMVERGGKIYLEADTINVASGSKLDASGATGGGEVLIGGDWQGAGEMHQATTVNIEQGAVINASAIESGDGGKIVA